MLLDISRALRAPGEEIPFLHRDAIPPQVIFGETVTFSEVTLTGFLCSVEDHLRVFGTLRTVAHGHCAGCLQPVDYPVEVPFDETFIRVTARDPRPEEENPEEEEWYYEGSKIELSHLAMTLTLLDLPIRFECGDDCPVLSRLHAEDDETTHACQKDMPDQHPFSALQQLLTKDQEV